MKKFKVEILTQAQDDFREAVKYYKDIDPKLGKRFVKVTKSIVNDLKKMPMFQIKYDQMRLRIIHKFPYTIHFMVNEEKHTIYIYGIRYAPFDPKTWPRT
jgi:toxin ParE1/3/4